MDPLLVVILLGLLFAYVNGMHDAATTIATSVATRALSPTIAVLMVSGFNLIGALLGDRVAFSISSRVIAPGVGSAALTTIGCALLGATVWSLLTWARGVPSSSSHALIGGLAGAGLVAGVSVHWDGLFWLLVVPMVVAPTAAVVLSFLVTLALLWAARDSSPSRSQRRFQHWQAVSAAALALGHGVQDAQKALAALVLALLAAGHAEAEVLSWWLRLLVAVSLATGTMVGGWRIVRTLGRRICDLDPPRGFAAESVAASLLYVSSYGLAAPVSTTHTLTAAIVGAGATRRLAAVRLRVVREISIAWLLTPIGAGSLAAVFFALATAIGMV